MSVPPAMAGHLGYLTPSEERKLQRTWVHIIRLCGNGDLLKAMMDEEEPEASIYTEADDGVEANGDTEASDVSKTNGLPQVNGTTTETNGAATATNVAAAVTNGAAAATNGAAAATNGAPKINGAAEPETNGFTKTNGTAVTDGAAVATNGAAAVTNGAPKTNGEVQSETKDAPKTNGAVEAGAVREVNGAPESSNVPKVNGASEASNVPTSNGASETNNVPKISGLLNPSGSAKSKGASKAAADFAATVPDMTEEFRKLLTDKSPEKFKKCFRESVKSSNPDALLLRFLRARKWDVEAATSMFVSSINWRMEMRLEEEVIRGGESVALKASATKDEKDFISQYGSGMSYVRGTDNNNHPVNVIRVKMHTPNARSAKTMENYILHNIENMLLLVREPHNKACLVFDLTGFGLRNMDFHLVKFIIQVFEARYPETLGLVLVHNAPFVFWGIWNVIKGWLDPVIAAKIHFTRGSSDMKRHIPKQRLQKCYGGDDTWEYKYAPPVPGENDKMNDTKARDAIHQEREDIFSEWEMETIRWMSDDATSPESKKTNERRMETAERLYENYWRLDPYVRSRTYYDRIGAREDKSVLNFGKDVA